MPLAGVAASESRVPSSKCAAQEPGQLIPGGVETTVPVPLTVTVTAWVTVGGGGEFTVAKVTVTAVSALRITLQVEPLQAPEKALSCIPVAGVAVSCTCMPAAKLAVHVEPQSIPAGVETTCPLPATFTDN